MANRLNPSSGKESEEGVEIERNREERILDSGVELGSEAAECGTTVEKSIL